MTTAREIIATTYIEGRTEPVGPLHAQAILAALTAAGLRIVGPEEVDPVTEAMVEAAREIIHGARHVYSDIDLARAALKAAMEAGQ